MIDYVLGFAFTADLSQVLLIRKNRSPKNLGDKMIGLLNGVGGKVEGIDDAATEKSGRRPEQEAMEREAREEAGLNLQWVYYCTLDVGRDTRVFCYYVVSDAVYDFKQMEDEQILLWNLSDERCDGYQREAHMPNIDWLIPMALNHYKKLDSAKSFTVTEH